METKSKPKTQTRFQTVFVILAKRKMKLGVAEIETAGALRGKSTEMHLSVGTILDKMKCKKRINILVTKY